MLAGFSLLAPIIMGFVLGGTRAGFAQSLSWGIGVAYWIAASIIVWGCLAIGTAIAARLLQPWRPPLWLTLLVGAMVGSIPGRYLVFWLAAFAGGVGDAATVPRVAPAFEWSTAFLIRYLEGWIGVFVVWIVLSYVLDAMLRARQNGASGASAPDAALPSPASAPISSPARADGAEQIYPAPALLAKLPPNMGQQIIAMNAEDHYVRVYTDRGDCLILTRFTDAVAAVAPLAGLRVHRSWWVNTKAIVSSEEEGRTTILHLANGLHVPVSLGYREVLRSHLPAR